MAKQMQPSHRPILDAFAGVLGRATARIEPAYFTLTTADHVEPIERERVYCYELYHQLRLAWPVAASNTDALGTYSVNGEVDKTGHAAFAGRLAGVKPDFVVHLPGRMDGNMVVMEVKRASASRASLCDDLDKLVAMLEQAQYRRGILLVFGQSWVEEPGELARIERFQERIASGDLQIYAHRAPGTEATLTARAREP